MPVYRMAVSVIAEMRDMGYTEDWQTFHATSHVQETQIRHAEENYEIEFTE